MAGACSRTLAVVLLLAAVQARLMQKPHSALLEKASESSLDDVQLEILSEPKDEKTQQAEEDVKKVAKKEEKEVDKKEEDKKEVAKKEVAKKEVAKKEADKKEEAKKEEAKKEEAKKEEAKKDEAKKEEDKKAEAKKDEDKKEEDKKEVAKKEEDKKEEAKKDEDKKEDDKDVEKEVEKEMEKEEAQDAKKGKKDDEDAKVTVVVDDKEGIHDPHNQGKTKIVPDESKEKKDATGPEVTVHNKGPLPDDEKVDVTVVVNETKGSEASAPDKPEVSVDVHTKEVVVSDVKTTTTEEAKKDEDRSSSGRADTLLQSGDLVGPGSAGLRRGLLRDSLARWGIQLMKKLLAASPLHREQHDQVIQHFDMQDPVKVADLAAGISSADRKALQDVLEEQNPKAKIDKVRSILEADLSTAKLQSEVKSKVEEKVAKEQKTKILWEQMRQIQKELGIEKDEKQTLTNQFREAIQSKELPEEVQKVIEAELAKLNSLEPSSSEFNVCRTYLEWLTCLPWGQFTPENRDIKHAEAVLDEDHYGLEDVKERILEHIAVSFLKDSTQGKIMCLVGPPGVGKTSVGKSVARALGRKLWARDAPDITRPCLTPSGLAEPETLRAKQWLLFLAPPSRLWETTLGPCTTSPPFAAMDATDGLDELALLDATEELRGLVGFEDPEVDLAHRLAFRQQGRAALAPLVASLRAGEPLPELSALRCVVRILGTLAGDPTGDTVPQSHCSGSELAQAMRSEVLTTAVLDLLQLRLTSFAAEEQPWILVEGLRALRLLLIVPEDAKEASVHITSGFAREP
ncbi:unnamed protein product [Symbiodinium natans]|uniref:ATPase AAA-type core domain-containing protein n=1 Tax=Symbiodinium natans TaxID=878477 RepID=A0A812HVU5_9DINO|nr:unnamed protein product [Symbiodinium natans]